MAVAIAARMYPELKPHIARALGRQVALLLERPDEVLVQQWRQMAGPVA